MNINIEPGLAFHELAQVMGDEVAKAMESAARALCRLEGNPENTRFEGKPMWQSYLPAAKAAIEAALPHLQGD